MGVENTLLHSLDEFQTRLQVEFSIKITYHVSTIPCSLPYYAGKKLTKVGSQKKWQKSTVPHQIEELLVLVFFCWIFWLHAMIKPGLEGKQLNQMPMSTQAQLCLHWHWFEFIRMWIYLSKWLGYAHIELWGNRMHTKREIYKFKANTDPEAISNNAWHTMKWICQSIIRCWKGYIEKCC